MFKPILRPDLRSRSSQTGYVAQRAGLDSPGMVQEWDLVSTAGTGVRLAAVRVERRVRVRRGRMGLFWHLMERGIRGHKLGDTTALALSLGLSGR